MGPEVNLGGTEGGKVTDAGTDTQLEDKSQLETYIFEEGTELVDEGQNIMCQSTFVHPTGWSMHIPSSLDEWGSAAHPDASQ
jgi:hypothetical protein